MRTGRETCVLMFLMAVALMAEKQYKSDAEYKLYGEVTTAFGANDAAKALTALETWKLDFPESDFAPERAQLFVQAYARGGQPAKAVEAARAALPGPFASAEDRLRLLYTVATAVVQIPSPPAELRSVAEEAAEKLLAFDEKPAATKPEDWEKGREALRGAARLALVHVVLTPVREAVKAGDCTGGEGDAVKAAERFHESIQASWVLASARLCLAKTDPGKWSGALYSLARAAALDPVRGMVDPAWQRSTAIPYLEKMYSQYHGSDAEGMRSLRELASTSPLPPDGFAVASVAQMEQKKQADLEARNPELALWLKIRAVLAGTNGLDYFASDLKGVDVPLLAGTVVEAKPACRPKELRLMMTEGGSTEVALIFDVPLAGRVEPGAVRFEGTATAFSADPFLLTFGVNPRKVSGIRTTPCTVRAR